MLGNTNAALLDYALDLRQALRRANADKAGLRAWAAGMAAPGGTTGDGPAAGKDAGQFEHAKGKGM